MSTESPITNGTNGVAQKTKTEKKPRMSSEMEKFDELFPELVDFLVNPGLKDVERTDAHLWFKEVLQYNVPHGKKNRGMFVAMSYQQLVSSASEDDLRIARILGWCIEMLQAFFLVADDVMDQSYTRRGKPCWFRKDNVGMVALNDCFYLESCIYQLLKHYIRDKPYYVNMLELFHEITLCTITGQCLDMIVSPPHGTVDFTNYTRDKYQAIVKWKTAFYSFYLPAAIAMYMAGIKDAVSHENAKAILLKVGEYFQAQDDFLDCYGEPAVIGKIGTDIQDNKCSWLVVKAINKASPQQLSLLKENYGSSDEAKISKVKELFKELCVEQAFRDFEEESFTEIMNLISKDTSSLPKDMFRQIVQKIYKRSK